MRISVPRFSAFLLLSLLAGNAAPRLFAPRAVEASPADVLGSPNVPVDSYTNKKGTYVLFANGRLLNSKAGAAAVDLGNPYRVPPAALNLNPLPMPGNGVKGSPNVAVKAVKAGTNTVILFADGTFKLPADNDAASADSDDRAIVSGIWNISQADPATYCSGGSFAPSGITVDVVFDKPYTKPPAVVAFGAQGGATTTRATFTLTGTPPSSNFQFVIVGDQ